jgi:hypothetical protein
MRRQPFAPLRCKSEKPDRAALLASPRHVAHEQADAYTQLGRDPVFQSGLMRAMRIAEALLERRKAVAR